MLVWVVVPVTIVPTLRLALAQVWVPIVSQLVGSRVASLGVELSVTVYDVLLAVLVPVRVKKVLPLDA